MARHEETTLKRQGEEMNKEKGEREHEKKADGPLICMRKRARMKRRDPGVVSCEWAGKRKRKRKMEAERVE